MRACGHSSPHLCGSVAVQAAVIVAEFNPKLTPPKSTVEALRRLVHPSVPTTARRLMRQPCSLVDHTFSTSACAQRHSIDTETRALCSFGIILARGRLLTGRWEQGGSEWGKERKRDESSTEKAEKCQQLVRKGKEESVPAFFTKTNSNRLYER